MADSSDRPDATAVGRREFLGLGVLPVAATLGASVAGVQAAPGARSTGTQKAPPGVVRIGIIGAGENVREVMIPAFRRIPECQLVAVANTSLASSQRVATQFDIPKPYPHWKALLDDQDIDAVCIGTWPYMHHPLTLASLEKGKHVLCQARMANNAQEAREMLAASLRHPDLVCQLVPTSGSYRVDNLLGKLLADGFVGELLSVEIQRVGRGFADRRRRARLASQPGVQRAERHEPGLHLRVDDALARPWEPGDGDGQGPRALSTRGQRTADLGHAPRSRRRALRAEQRGPGPHALQRDDRPVERQPDLDPRHRGHHLRRRSPERPRRDARRHAATRDSQSSGRPGGRRASRRNSSGRSAGSSRSR